MPRQQPITFDLVLRFRITALRCSRSDVVDGVDNILDDGAIQKLIVAHVAEEIGTPEDAEPIEIDESEIVSSEIVEPVADAPEVSP